MKTVSQQAISSLLIKSGLSASTSFSGRIKGCNSTTEGFKTKKEVETHALPRESKRHKRRYTKTETGNIIVSYNIGSYEHSQNIEGFNNIVKILQDNGITGDIIENYTDPDWNTYNIALIIKND